MLRSPPRRFAVLAIAVVIAAAASLAGVAALIARDPKSLIERYATHVLGRTLTIGALDISWGDPLRVTLRDLAIANAEWGSAPDFLRIATLSAAIELSSLAGDALRYRELRVEGGEFLLERNAAGAANWRFGASRGSGGRGGDGGLVPKNRTQFPTLFDAAIDQSRLIYRRPGHADIRLAFERLTVHADDEALPVVLETTGSYGATPVRLTATGASFVQLRNGAVAYPAQIALATPRGRVDFSGTLDEPVDFDGARGAVRIETADIGAFLSAFGVPVELPAPLQLRGAFIHAGESWRVANAEGAFAGNAWTGALGLVEGPRGQPDNLDFAAAFGRVDVKALLAQLRRGDGPVSLVLDREPGALVEGRLTARQVDYGALSATDLRFRGRRERTGAVLDELALRWLDGGVTAKGRADAAGTATAIAGEVSLTGLDSAQLLRQLGAARDELLGRLDGGLSFTATGATLEAALRANRGQAALAMDKGQVARALLERVSLDLRAIFRRNEQWSALSCLFAAAELRDGVVTIAPAALRTPDTGISATGTVDLPQRRIDATLAADRTTTVLALKVPIRISGPLADPSIAPAPAGAPPAPALAAPLLAPLAPALARLRPAACAS